MLRFPIASFPLLTVVAQSYECIRQSCRSKNRATPVPKQKIEYSPEILRNTHYEIHEFLLE